MSEDRTGTQNSAAGPENTEGRRAPEGLTERQRTILDVIRASVTSRGYPPSIREIGDAVGLTSTSSVAHQLRTLERKGYLRRDPNRPRAVDVRGADDLVAPVVATDRRRSVPPSAAISQGVPDSPSFSEGVKYTSALESGDQRGCS